MTLGNLIDQYVTYRRSLGEKYITNASFLKTFSRINGMSNKDINTIKLTEDMIVGYLKGKSGRITTAWFNKYSTLLGLSHYVTSRGYVFPIPLPKVFPKKPLRFIPYIYSKKELKLLFDTALTYQRGKSHIQPKMIRVILILTYALGLRISETLGIKLKDINFNNDTIVIHNSKFYKTRLLPFNLEVRNLLLDYFQFRIEKNQPQEIDAYFFIGRENNAVVPDTLNGIFQQIRHITGIKRNDNASFQPRIHDLRHTFAVNRLIGWYQNNEDVNILLPILSTYLGHVTLSETSVYLSMTKELLKAAKTKFETYVFGELK